MLGNLDAILAPLPAASATTVVKLPTDVSEADNEKSPAVPAVKERGQPITEQALLASLEDALQERFRPSGDLDLVLLRELPDLSQHDEPFMLNLVNAPSRLSPNNALARFEIENLDGVIGQYAIPFRAQVMAPVWFVKAHLRKGDAVTRSDFEMRHEDLLKAPDAVTSELDTLLRHEYGRDVTPGRPLVWGDIRERSLVHKGEVVDVTVSKGLMAITMRAMARQDGADGDIITLRNLESSKDFAGRVVGVNKIDVVF